MKGVAIKGGSIVALVTPMTTSNAIDYDKLISLLKWHVSEGSDGIVILGTTGESSTISHEERTKIIETAVKTVNSAFPVIVGTGTIDTNKVIESSKHAESLGADGVLVITPYYVKPPQRALITHFKTVADSIKIPVILYNCPGRTGVSIAIETVAECAKHPNIIGMRDICTHIYYIYVSIVRIFIHNLTSLVDQCIYMYIYLYFIGLKDAVGNILERLPDIRKSCKSDFLLYRSVFCLSYCYACSLYMC